MADVTEILSQIESGDSHAAVQLLPLVYGELRQLAAAKLAAERPGQTLQATALVHEAYLRLVSVDVRSGEQPPGWNSRAHFFGAAAEAMRQILVDQARKKLSLKRGGDRARQDIESHEISMVAAPEEIVRVHDALDALAAEDSLAAELVKLHYFAGFSIEEAAANHDFGQAETFPLR